MLVPPPRPHPLLLLLAVLAAGPLSAQDPAPTAGPRGRAGCAEDSPLTAVRIGDQLWSTTNLATTRYRNGDPIPRAESAEQLEEFGHARVGAWMYVAGDPETVCGLGLLYNWYAAADPRGLGPEGWRLPTDDDWQRLADFLGPDSAGYRMKAPDGWADGGGGSNISGFTARPAGFRAWREYLGIGVYGSWWTATELDDDYYAWFRGVGADYEHIHRERSTKYFGMSIRLVRELERTN